MEDSFTLNPGESVGQISLGLAIEKMAEIPGYRRKTGHNRYRERTSYENEELGIEVYAGEPDEPGIDSIHCEQTLTYKGGNLIGMHINALTEHLELMPDLALLDFFDFGDGDEQFVFEFEGLGLQAWVRKEDMAVESIIVSRIYDGDD